MSERPRDSRISPERFFETILPQRFDERVGALEREIGRLARELDALRALRATLRFRLEGPGGGDFFVNIAEGRLRTEPSALVAPFVTVHQTVEDWRRAVERDGARAFGIVGGATGPTGLAPERIDRMRELSGSVRVALTELPGQADGAPWTVTASFGEAPPEPPTTTISMTYEVAEELRRGKLNPQQAFMAGKIRLAGDMGFALRLGMLMV